MCSFTGGGGGFLVGFGMRLVGFCGRVIGCGTGCETSSLNASLSSNPHGYEPSLISFASIAS